MRDNYLKKLEQMQKELLEMGMLCEEAIQKTYRLLVSEQEREELVKAIDVLEREIDAKERRIEADCIQLFLQQQPVASDLRLISSALKMITDLERIGDHATDIPSCKSFSLQITLSFFIKLSIIHSAPEDRTSGSMAFGI